MYKHTLLIDNGFGSRQTIIFCIQNFRLPSKVHSLINFIQQSHHLLLSWMSLYKLLLFLNGFALLWLYFTVSKLFCQEVFYLFIISLPVPVCHLLHPDYEYISSYLLPSVPIMPVQRSDSEFSQHHKTAPGPPSAIAVPTPTMLPVPIAFNNSIPSFPPYSFICKKTPGIFHPRSLLPTIFF